jgi:hypothetical protein
VTIHAEGRLQQPSVEGDAVLLGDGHG